MAGRIQKPYDQLQNKRGNRRRPPVQLRPVAYRAPEEAEEAEEEQSPRDRAIDVAIGAIERSFGRGTIAKVSPIGDTPREKPKRKYRPRGERPVSDAKAKIADARPRDERGHFLPMPGSRRGKIRAAGAGAVPEALAGVTGTEEGLLATLAPPPAKAKRPNLIEVAAELGDEELDQVIAALVRLREARGRH